MRFLIDECLTTALISVANLRGHDAQQLAVVGEPINQVLEVELVGADVEFNLYGLHAT